MLGKHPLACKMRRKDRVREKWGVEENFCIRGLLPGTCLSYFWHLCQEILESQGGGRGSSWPDCITSGTVCVYHLIECLTDWKPFFAILSSTLGKTRYLMTEKNPFLKWLFYGLCQISCSFIEKEKINMGKACMEKNGQNIIIKGNITAFSV